jgi:hypothetical protein
LIDMPGGLPDSAPVESFRGRGSVDARRIRISADRQPAARAAPAGAGGSL